MKTASVNLMVAEILFLVLTCPFVIQELGVILFKLDVPIVLQGKEGDAHPKRNATSWAGWSKIWLNRV